MSSDVSILQRIRLVFGFLAATALPGLLIAMPFLVAGKWHLALDMIALGLRITVPPVIVVAVPLFFWLSKTKRLNIFWAALAGGAAGAAFGLFGVIEWIWRFGSNKAFYDIWKGALAYTEPHLFILIGAFCGVVGWLIAFGPRVAPRVGRASEV
jgi:hypothetical protein